MVRASICSGLMYCSVPMLCVLVACAVSSTFAIPKSITFTVPDAPESMTFSGFRSR